MGDYIEAAIRRMLEQKTKGARSACGGDDLVAAYLEGVLENDQRCRFEEHASNCPNCLEVMGLAMKLAAVPDAAEAAAARVRAPVRKTLFRISIPLAAVAAAAVLVIAGAVVLYSIRDTGGGAVQVAELRTTSAVEQDRSLAAPLPEMSAPDKVAGSAPPSAALPGMRDKSPALPEPASTLGAGRAAPAESPGVPLPRASPEVALARTQAAEPIPGDAALIRALVASAPEREQATAPAAGQVGQRMLPEQTEGVARSDSRASARIAIQGRTFQDRGAYWVDDGCAVMAGAEIVEIGPDTKEYREIMASYPEIRGLLAGGKSVVLCLNGRICVLR